MSEVIDRVESVCPVCLGRIDGVIVSDGDTVSMVKTCPAHGTFSTVIWRGMPSYGSWSRPKTAYRGGRRQTGTDRGCPYDCGLCPEHGQRTCTALVEVTGRCNLGCPICFAESGADGSGDQDLAALAQRFVGVFEATGGCNLQLSGGEPTVRNDLPAVIQAAAAAGFSFIQLNTNGLRLAAEPDLAAVYREAGLSSVFLQFDGLTDKVYGRLRSRPLLEIKMRALENMARAGLPVVLVPTVVQGVNDDQLWQIARFGMDRLPLVRGVHFQPLSLFGRYPADLAASRVTLPEIMTGLQEQSSGQLRAGDFRPPGCEHALCSFNARYFVDLEGAPRRLGAGNSCDCRPIPADEGAKTAIAVTARQWGDCPPQLPMAPRPPDDLDLFLERARTHTFSITAMAFQDAWNLNLERLRGCCIHVAPPEGGLVPFCAYNLTAADGTPLHRRQR